MSDSKPRLVVGIGASAGGLKPIEEFFQRMPPNTGMAFVVVQHLSPDFKSLMDELLGRQTGMTIHRVTDGIELEANHIYLIPPKSDLTISEGRLMLMEQQKTRGLNLPIDSFFVSLAENIKKDAVAIVLSGSGSDGARGVKAINEAGGLVVVQAPDTAGFDSMPNAAIKTNAVDLVCEVNDMPSHLMDYCSHHNAGSFRRDENSDVNDDGLGWLCKFFQDQAGINFSYYKPATIQRRMERRMQLATVSNLSEYQELVETNRDEADALFRDLLVEVTRFFRDPEAFELLRDKVIPQLIRDSKDDDEFRGWVCGCATGEEAYSIAMLVHDCMSRASELQKPFKIFATDVHPNSVEFAGEGIFSERSLEKLPEDFRKRYFTKVENGFKVKQEIRQRIIFAINDATKDPPFTKLNLVSCRNMLIYLLPEAQRRILSVFHFGLKKNGVLFLGPSETVADLGNEFEEVDRHWRMFRKRRDVRLPDTTRIALDTQPAIAMPFRRQKSLRKLQKQVIANSSLNSLISRYVPPSLLVDEYNELVHCIGNARELLTFPEGKPTNNVLQLLSKELNVPVSAALHRCRRSGETVVFKGVRLQFPDKQESHLFQLQVESVDEDGENLFLISFTEMAEQPVRKTTELDFKPLENAEEQIDELKLELNYTRETLQATVEELESSNEELQATNEELIASNEELQSTNEELQSTNEELHTVNQENRYRINQLNEVTEDLELLLSRTATGILFLDKGLNIRKFTRSITRYFDLQPADTGRSIENFNHRTGVPNLYQQLKDALDSGSEFTVESDFDEEDALLVEVAIKREYDNIVGVMLTVGRKTVQGFGLGSRQFYLPVGAGFWQWPNVKEDDMWWSPKCFQLLGLKDTDLPSRFSSWRKLVHPDDAGRLRNAGTEDCTFVQQGYLVLRMKCADDRYRKFEYRAAFVMDDNDKPKSMMGSLSPFEEKSTIRAPHSRNTIPSEFSGL